MVTAKQEAMLGPLPRVVGQRAIETPDRLLCGTAAGERRTYADVHAAGQSWAALLERLGVTVGQTVGVMLPTMPVSVEAWLGLGSLGAIEVPINTAYRTRMLHHILEDSLAEVMIIHATYLDALREVADGLTRLRTVVVVGDAADDAAGLPLDTYDGPGPEDVAPTVMHDPQPHDLACVLYTSGTTGPSKGVMVTWTQLLATATGSCAFDEYDSDDVFYAPFPLFHISGKNLLYLASVLGGSVVLKEQFKTDEFWSDIATHGCTSTILLGAMANFLYRQPEQPAERENPLTHVNMIPVIADVEGFKKRFGVNVFTVFNMTETSCPLHSDGYRLANTRSCGRQRPGYQVRLVDEFDYEVPVGELGELIVRSDEPWAQMAGYWQRPEATVEAWRNQWLHTGDVFTRDEDGNFYFVDRRKDAIRRRGENISSFEVEAHVNEFDAVLESAAIAVASEFGEDEVKIAVVAKPGVGLDAAALMEFLRVRMPPFMVPRYVELVDELPKTPTQKIRKVVLKEAGITPATLDFAPKRMPKA